MKNIKECLKAFGLVVFAVIILALFIVIIVNNCGGAEVENVRPDIEVCYGEVYEKDGLYGAWSPDGDFVAMNPEKFDVGDKVITIIYYNPNNQIHDDIIKIVREKVVE